MNNTQQHRLLVVGVGSIGERHVRCFQQTGRAEVSICELNDDLRRKVADEYKTPRAHANLEDALAEKPEAVVICTPAHLHIPMALQSAESGAHLLIEKPLSTSLDGVDQLCQLVDRQQIKTAVAYVTRTQPLLSAMREALAQQRFGRPVELVAVGGQNFPFFRPAYRDIYYNNRATGGGAIQDALTHTINACEWMIGPMTEVAADAAHMVLEGVDVEDTVHVVARHGEVMASYSLNQHQAPNESTITVVCDRGTVRFEAHENRWRWKTSTEEDWQQEDSLPQERDAPFIRQADAFLDYLEDRRPPLCTLEEGLQTLRVNLAILQAVESRAWQTISPTAHGTE